MSLTLTGLFHRSHAQRRLSSGGFLNTLLAMDSLRRQRRQLRDLPAELLDDIGISRDEADAEAARPCWDAPRFWHL